MQLYPVKANVIFDMIRITPFLFVYNMKFKMLKNVILYTRKMEPVFRCCWYHSRQLRRSARLPDHSLRSSGAWEPPLLSSPPKGEGFASGKKAHAWNTEQLLLTKKCSGTAVDFQLLQLAACEMCCPAPLLSLAFKILPGWDVRSNLFDCRNASIWDLLQLFRDCSYVCDDFLSDSL